MHEETPGLIVATLNARSHYVSVDIKYDAQNYSLSYNQGRNGGNIHPKYNKWISTLDRAIQLELSDMPRIYSPPPASAAQAALL
jgi:hypothetical protein